MTNKTEILLGGLKNQAQNSDADAYKTKIFFYGDFIGQVFPDGLSAAGNLFFDPFLASVKLTEENIYRKLLTHFWRL